MRSLRALVRIFPLSLLLHPTLLLLHFGEATAASGCPTLTDWLLPCLLSLRPREESKWRDPPPDAKKVEEISSGKWVKCAMPRSRFFKYLMKVVRGAVCLWRDSAFLARRCWSRIRFSSEEDETFAGRSWSDNKTCQQVMLERKCLLSEFCDHFYFFEKCVCT